MGKKQVDLKTYDDDLSNGKIFVISQNISGFNEYERAKAINRFINSEIKVLITCVETYIRQILINAGIVPPNGTKKAIKEALEEYKIVYNKSFDFKDRYKNMKESIVGEKDEISVILEDDILSCAMEVGVIENG